MKANCITKEIHSSWSQAQLLFPSISLACKKGRKTKLFWCNIHSDDILWPLYITCAKAQVCLVWGLLKGNKTHILCLDAKEGNVQPVSLFPDKFLD